MRVALLLAPLSCVMFGCGTAPSVAPEAEIVQATVEGPGTALAGRPIRFTLHIVNTGNKDVSLRTVIPGCGCTALECEAQSILPGESVRIAGEMSARKRCGIHNIGLTCEFGDGSTLRVGRSVSVVSGIEATPRTVSLRPNGEDSALCHVDVTVTNRLTSPVHLRVVNSAADHVDSLSVFPMELTLTPGARQTLRVACANDELLRREGVVRLMSSGAVNTMVTIPLVVAPTDGITLSRSIIHLGYVTREDAKLRALASIDVDSAAGAKWELQEAECPADFLNAFIEAPSGVSPRHRVSLRFATGRDIPSVIDTSLRLSFIDRSAAIRRTVNVAVKGVTEL